jgi:hypothetical protein
MNKSNNNKNIIMESIDDTVRENGESQSDMSISQQPRPLFNWQSKKVNGVNDVGLN